LRADRELWRGDREYLLCVVVGAAEGQR
jgi:hypothetical protein